MSWRDNLRRPGRQGRHGLPGQAALPVNRAENATLRVCGVANARRTGHHRTAPDRFAGPITPRRDTPRMLFIRGRRRAPTDGQGVFPFLRGRLYHNRHPEDSHLPVVCCRLRFIGGRWRTISPTGCRRTAKGIHNFVVQEGVLLVQRPVQRPGMPTPAGHVDLARGEPVEFAGEILFGGRSGRRGVLIYWNDRTGHYHEHGEPMDPRVVPLLPIRLFRAFDYGG